MECRHPVLATLPAPPKKLRCRVCNLTISAVELGGSYCPECYEAGGQRHDDFEEVGALPEATRYRCETCGLVIES